MIDERAAFFGMTNVTLSLQDAEGSKNSVISDGRVGHAGDDVGHHGAILFPKGSP